jgi:hypothetical protein
MIRRVVFGVVLLSMAGTAASALADTGTGTGSGTDKRGLTHELCIAMSKDPDHHSSQDYCITWPGPVLQP